MTTTIHTIGHSRHAIEVFMDLLRKHGIATLVDVRSKPHSRWASQFGKGNIEQSLAAAGIDYVYMGSDLGGMPEGAEFRDGKGQVDFGKVAASPGFRAGIDRLVGIAKRSATAIMCAEEDPAKCHREFMIAPALEAKGVTILHVRGDGSVQGNDDQGREAPP